jgi:probable addiction module antidote protein
LSAVQKRDAGLGRESLYKAIYGQGNPSFATILKAPDAMYLAIKSSGEWVLR